MTRTGVRLTAGLFLAAACLAVPRLEAQSGARLRLTRDTVLAGVSCAATDKAYAALHANGALDECPLPRDSVLNGQALPAGTWVRLTPEGVLRAAWLPREVRLDGIPCKGTGYKGWSVEFHPNGRLALCFLARETEIQGIPCRGASFVNELRGNTSVVMGPEGRLRGCRLARDVTLAGVTYHKGNRLEITPVARR